MKQRQLVENVCILLLRNGYVVKSLMKSCFDVIARHEDKVLLVKAVEDANSLGKEVVGEMVRVSEYLSGVPVIIAEKAGFVLERNVVYMRQGVYTLSLDTFSNSVVNKMPFIKSSKAGVTVQVDGDALRRKREAEGLSLNELAEKVGVSRNMIQKYEHGAEITVKKAVRMYDAFGGEVFKRIDVFARHKLPAAVSCQTGELSKKYVELGFKAEETRKSPFDIIAKNKHELILTSVGDKVNPHVAKVSDLLDADKLMIYKKRKPKDVPSLKKKEFLDIGKAKELIKFLKES